VELKGLFGWDVARPKSDAWLAAEKLGKVLGIPIGREALRRSISEFAHRRRSRFGENPCLIETISFVSGVVNAAEN
jgi:hypothetical protein